MLICIFGATGLVGKQLVSQALHMGHEVRAFGRNVFTAGFPEDEHLELIQGALFDATDVAHAVKGADAVFSAIGGGFDGTDKTRSLGMKQIVAQMTVHGINRIVVVGGMGCLPASADKLIMDIPDFPPQFLPVSREHLEAYHYLAASSLNFTFVCAPDILPKLVTGNYTVALNSLPEPNNHKINAGDLALFMLREVHENTYPRSKVGISNT
ncbi:MAG: NAD(P)H-binding protein [Sphingobacteriales bacterium]|nr:NAD(P)H-binding protein [Sphingobacteriales bacterium]